MGLKLIVWFRLVPGKSRGYHRPPSREKPVEVANVDASSGNESSDYSINSDSVFTSSLVSVNTRQRSFCRGMVPFLSYSLEICEFVINRLSLYYIYEDGWK